MTEENAAASGVPILDLISSFEDVSTNDGDIKNSSVSESEERMLPSPLQLYQLGLVLHDSEQTDASLVKPYQDFLGQLPLSYLTEVVLHELNAAFITVVRVNTGSTQQAIQAVNSLCGIYSNSPLACRAGFSLDLCTSMATFYNKQQQKPKTRQPQEQLYDNLLRTLSVLLLDGLLSTDSSKSFADPEAHLSRVMDVVQAMTANDESTCLGDLQEWQERSPSITSSKTLQNSVQTLFDDSPQRDYLLRMLESCTTRSSTKTAPVSTVPVRSFKHEQIKNPSTTNSNKNKKSISEIRRRIQQVREVLPDLGEGYIETALSCYQGDVSRTLAALLEGEGNTASLHPTLQVLDKTLPARKQETSKSSAYNQHEDEEAKRITKTRLAEMERKEEAEAYALSIMKSEYDDDYDDQYDGLDGGGTGGADVGMYDVDLNTIKTYNRVAREAEQEDVFWEQNKNLNRESRKGGAAAGENGEERRYRGPDKGKGGRVLGPDGLPIQKGGKKGRQQRAKNKSDTSETNGAKATSTGGSDNMSKIQKRRKNDNKAKIANHHRKERALKKSGGM